MVVKVRFRVSVCLPAPDTSDKREGLFNRSATIYNKNYQDASRHFTLNLRPSRHVSLTQPFLRLRLNPLLHKNRILISPSPSRHATRKTVALSGFAPMSLTLFEPSRLSTTTRPVRVCRIRPTLARMSTDRPAAETILNRANHVKTPCKCSKFVRP